MKISSWRGENGRGWFPIIGAVVLGMFVALAPPGAASAAQGQAAPAAKNGVVRTPAPAPANSVPTLYELHYQDARAYLFGTIHALPRNIDWFRPPIAQALDRSKVLVMETVVPSSPEALTPTILKIARRAAPSPVAERVPEAWQPILESALQSRKAGPMDWYDTWFIAISLGNLEAEAQGLDPRLGVESVLNERAKMQRIPVKGLESAEEQLLNFDLLPEADQQAVLVATLRDLDKTKTEYEGEIANWMTGRFDRIAAQVDREFQASPRLRRMLVEDRNKRWADALLEEMRHEKGPIFIAVGAGHLAGPGSLVDELKKRGIKLAAVPGTSVPVDTPANMNTPAREADSGAGAR